MAEARARDAWDHTAALLALTFNVHRGAKTKAARVEDFHPMREAKRPKMTVADLHALKPTFMRNKKKPQP